MTEEFKALQVEVRAVLVGTPLFPCETVVQHCRNCVRAERVHVVYVHPEEGRGYEEVGYFGLAQIEGLCAPLRIFCAQRVGVFVERSAVKPVEAEFVLGEVRGHPV